MKPKTISIIGGYGATGAVVARKLASETIHIINIVGRNMIKAYELANEIGKNTKYVQLDIFDESKLRNLCRKSDIIVNCAGPSAKIKDRIAIVAIKENCHYVDAGGYEFTYEMLKGNNYFSNIKTCCVFSAGWIPGIAEVLASYSDYLANEIFDQKENMNVFYGDRNVWSDIGLLDTIQYIKKNSLRDMSFVRSGKIKRLHFWGFTKKFDLPFGVGKQRGYLHLIPELKPFALNNTEYRIIKSYLVLFGWRTFLAMMKIYLFLNSEINAIETLKKAYRNEVDSKGVLGVSVVEITGLKGGVRQKLQTGIISNGGYTLTGLGCAATVILLLDEKIKAGVKYLPEAINATEFMEILNNWDVKVLKKISTNP